MAEREAGAGAALGAIAVAVISGSVTFVLKGSVSVPTAWSVSSDKRPGHRLSGCNPTFLRIIALK